MDQSSFAFFFLCQKIRGGLTILFLTIGVKWKHEHVNLKKILITDRQGDELFKHLILDDN